MNTKTTTAIGAFVGVVGATGIAVTAGSQGGFFSALNPISAASGEQICLLSDAPFFADLNSGCYPRSLLDELYTRDIVNARGDRVTMTMSSPPEAAEASDDCKTCADYERMQRLGWFALSNRDQRREEFFRRACTLLDYLRTSEKPAQTWFVDGQLNESDIAAIPTSALMQLTAWPGGSSDQPTRHGGALDGEAVRRNMARSADEQGWPVEVGDQHVTIQPLVHADFDADTNGDILVYVRSKLMQGTAFYGAVGYLTKTEENGAVEFRTRESQ